MRKKLCLAANKRRQGLYPQSSDQNSTLPKVWRQSALGCFQGQIWEKKKKNKRFHCTCPLHGKSLEQCEMLYILEIYQPDLVHLKITESLPQALLGFGLGYVF